MPATVHLGGLWKKRKCLRLVIETTAHGKRFLGSGWTALKPRVSSCSTANFLIFHTQVCRLLLLWSSSRQRYFLLYDITWPLLKLYLLLMTTIISLVVSYLELGWTFYLLPKRYWLYHATAFQTDRSWGDICYLSKELPAPMKFSFEVYTLARGEIYIWWSPNQWFGPVVNRWTSNLYLMSGCWLLSRWQKPISRQYGLWEKISCFLSFV